MLANCTPVRNLSKILDACHYLIDSIRVFPDQQQLAALFEQADFEQVSFRKLSCCITCLHCGHRPGTCASQ